MSPRLSFMLALASSPGLAGCGDKASSDSGSATGSDGSSGDDGSGDDGSGGDGGGDDGDGDSQQDQNLASSAGQFAGDFLRSDSYTSVLIEVDHVTGSAPDATALDELVGELEDILDKPGGVSWELDDEIPDQGAPAWTIEDNEALELEYRDHYRDPDTGQAVIYLLYLDGTSAEDPDSGGYVLAYAYRGSSLTVFEARVEQSGGTLPLAGSVEKSVLLHEVGHLLGLVDNGVDMVEDHKDRDHGDHCEDEGCIMYWAVNSPDVADFLLSAEPTFDAACLADMAAVQEADD